MSSVIVITTGEPGAGKSYIRAARFLVDDFLMNTDGIHISNFPLNVEAIASEVAAKKNRFNKSFFARFIKRRSVITKADILKRIFIIPDDVLATWRNQTSGPWDYFSNSDLRGCHIALDEIHEIISLSKNQDYIDKWDEFLGQIRHRGCTFEGLTQDLKAVHPCLVNRAGLRYEIYPAENTRDPFFKILMYDWYQLKAAFTGDFHKTIFQLEKKKSGSGKWRVNHSRRFLIIPEYYKFYNSYSASHQERENSSDPIDDNRTPQYEFQKLSRTGVLFWFIRKNLISLILRLFAIITFMWILLFGGLNKILIFFTRSITSVSSSSVAPTKKNTINPASKKTDQKKLLETKKNSPSPLLPYVPVMIMNNHVQTLGGLSFGMGYKFNNKESLLYGKKVVFIDPYNRSYTLSDGSIIRMQQIHE